MSKTNVQIALDVTVKEVDLTVRGSLINQEEFSTMSLVGELPNAKENIKEILAEEGEIQKIITPFIPEKLNFGVYKLSDKKKSITAFQIAAQYEKFKIQGVISKEIKLFSVGIAEEISLKELPLVGEYLKDYAISNIELVYVSKSEQSDDNKNILIDYTKKQFVNKNIWINDEQVNLGNSFSAGLVFKTGNDENKITYPGFNVGGINIPSLPIKNDIKSNPKSNKVSSPSSVEKQPLVKINEIVPSIVNNDAIQIAISADFNIGTFGLQLVGLAIKVPFKVFQSFSLEKLWNEIEFSLKGMAVVYDTPTLGISGAFLREIKDNKEEYNGLLTFRMGKIELIAIGSYIKTPTYSSLFAFGYLGIPIPVDPAFYIHGFALGFGMNRNFLMPNISEVPNFPLVKLVHQGGLKQGDSIQKIFSDLNRYLPACEDTYVIVAGIKFDSYKMIYTTGIVAIAFGNKTSFNLLGLSTMKMPGVYNFEFAFSMRADLDEGIFLAQGQLTDNTYILLPQLKLTGGFALGMWLKGSNSGDFVFSIGGYHPKFNVPSHYPNNISRLGFDFNMGPVQLYGKAYFALTPSCIMAGIEGGLRVKLNAGVVYAEIGILLKVDFIIHWKPFYYEAEVSVQIYAKVVIDVWLFSINSSFSLAAKLFICGPDFKGVAVFKVVGYQLEVKFGNHNTSINKTLTQSDFISAYLPEIKNIISYNITSGIIKKIKKVDGSECIVVNPKTFALEVYSEIPITDIYDTQLNIERLNTPSPIYPVFTESDKLTNKLKLGVQGATKDFKSFVLSPIYRSVPKSIWNTKNSISETEALSNDNLLKNVCNGVKLEFSKVISQIKEVEVSLYDSLEKEIHLDNKNLEINFINRKEKLDNSTMIGFEILNEDDIDLTDLENDINAYKYKESFFGTYKVEI